MIELEPNEFDRKKFDLDLSYGKVREKLVADILQDKKLEVKSERDLWANTGNICIEFECYGKPSGIAVTEADYWFHNLCIKDDTYATLVFKTDDLKEILDNMENKRVVYGGDNKAAKMYLIGLQKLFDAANIRSYRDRRNA